MNCADEVGYTYEGAFYCCEDCLPNGITNGNDDVGAVFAGDEWDYYPTCDNCLQICDSVGLTTDGEQWLKSRQEV